MHLGYFAAACLSIAISGIDVGDAIAQDVVKIGIVIPMTGGFASVGREVAAGAKLYIHQHGETVAGRKVELIIRDDAAVPDAGKRLAQELIVKDKVSFLGAGITPTAMAMAPLATEAKLATVVLVSGTSVVTERSLYYVRTSFTLGQQSGIIADWATQMGAKRRSPSSAIGHRVPRRAKSLTNISPRAAA
jgi:branched-chain amino acid transport system substrate-binding protein